MFSSTTTYTRGDIVVEVPAGESHSAAWAAVTGGLAPAGRSPARGGGGRRRCEHRRPRARTAARRGRARQPA